MKKRKKTGDCIYGHANVELSGEHYLPKCLGNFRGFEMLNNRVCVSCNNLFGQLEEQFCRSGPEAFFRYLSGVKGYKHHTKIKPFRRGSAGADRMRLEAKFPGQDFDVLWEPNERLGTLDYMTQIILRTDEGTFHIPISDDMTDPTQLGAKLEEHGIKHAKEVRILAAESQIARVEALLSVFTSKGSIEWQRSPEKGAVQGLVTISVTDKYFRALAKIGFHYFLKHTSRFRGDEDAFAGIREFIMNGGDYRQFVGTSTKQIVGQTYYGEFPGLFVHIIASRVTYSQMWCYLQFFLRHDYLAPVHKIRLGKNPSKIHYDQSWGHSFEYYEDGPRDGYYGLMQEVTPVRKSLLG